MVKFWIEGGEGGVTVCSNLVTLDLGSMTVAELVGFGIDKWEFMAAALEDNKDFVGDLSCGGCDTCALCQRFLVPQNYCKGCPIVRVAGEAGCFGTPFDEYRMWGADPEIVAAEVEFLYKVLQEVEDGV